MATQWHDYHEKKILTFLFLVASEGVCVVQEECKDRQTKGEGIGGPNGVVEVSSARRVQQVRERGQA